MKKNKGFTLIELLAVIVILAVIALIATPIIMNVINDSKKGAAKDAMLGYVKAVELASAKLVTSTTDAPSGTYAIADGNLVKDGEILNVSFKGIRPKNDSGGVVVLSKGIVTYASLLFDTITVTYDGKIVEVGPDGSTPIAPPKTYHIGEVVYFDPTGAVENCDTTKIWTPSNTGTTCYKWNVVKDNGETVEMLLDHDSSYNIVWHSYDSVNNGPKEVMYQLRKDTSNWSKVEEFTADDTVTREYTDSGRKGTYRIYYSGMRGRLISAQEIADIAGDKVWNSAERSDIIYSDYTWLYQNTYNSGDKKSYGYWTDTAISNGNAVAWRMNYDGTIGHYNVSFDDGLRPVVRVLKSNIK